MESNWLEINRQFWDAATPYHVSSDFYAQDEFLKGKSSMNEIELHSLGDVRGKKILHLQCHFGQDSLSLQRMGALVTGVDFSVVAIRQATDTARALALDTTFIQSDVYSLPDILNDSFDIVFASYGVLGWLPDIKRWADVIDHFLKPGGKLVLVEFHPALWMLDSEFRQIGYDYFNTAPITETVAGTYADRSAPMKKETISWNHSLSEVMTALLKNKLRITSFQEYDHSPYACFPNMAAEAPGQYRFLHVTNQIPMLYALVAEKEGLSAALYYFVFLFFF